MPRQVFQTYVHILPHTPPQVLGDYVQPRHLL